MLPPSAFRPGSRWDFTFTLKSVCLSWHIQGFQLFTTMLIWDIVQMTSSLCYLRSDFMNEKEECHPGEVNRSVPKSFYLFVVERGLNPREQPLWCLKRQLEDTRLRSRPPHSCVSRCLSGHTLYHAWIFSLLPNCWRHSTDQLWGRYRVRFFLSSYRFFFLRNTILHTHM